MAAVNRVTLYYRKQGADPHDPEKMFAGTTYLIPVLFYDWSDKRVQDALKDQPLLCLKLGDKVYVAGTVETGGNIHPSYEAEKFLTVEEQQDLKGLHAPFFSLDKVGYIRMGDRQATPLTGIVLMDAEYMVTYYRKSRHAAQVCLNNYQLDSLS